MTFNIVADDDWEAEIAKSKIVWRSMRDRCERRKSRAYKNYGGRGIAVCNRWLSFEAFFTDMGAPPIGCELDRIDNDGDYSPENCRWATRKQNARNQRRTARVTIGGVTRTVLDCADEFGVKPKTIKARLKNGWDVTSAVTTATRARMVEINGDSKSLAEWCRVYGANFGTVRSRIVKGMLPFDALTKPLFRGQRHV